MLYITLSLKLCPVFFFISETDLFSRKGSFADKMSQGNTGMLTLFFQSRLKSYNLGKKKKVGR